jgi:hypothetical protein
MNIFNNPVINSIIENVLGEFVFTILAVIAAQTLIKWWYDWRYGGWHLTVIKDDEKKIDQLPISSGKMKQVREIPEDMPVFLKGMCSHLKHINCFLMEDGVELGVLNEDYETRNIVINLDKDNEEEVSDHQTY